MVAAFTQKTLGGETAGRYRVGIQTEPTAEREGPRGEIKYPNTRKKSSFPIFTALGPLPSQRDKAVTLLLSVHLLYFLII